MTPDEEAKVKEEIQNNILKRIQSMENVDKRGATISAAFMFFNEALDKGLNYIGADGVIGTAFFGDSYTFFDLKAFIGQQINCHTSTAKSAARTSDGGLLLFLGDILHFDLGGVGEMCVFKLVYIFHIGSPFLIIRDPGSVPR